MVARQGNDQRNHDCNRDEHDDADYDQFHWTGREKSKHVIAPELMTPQLLKATSNRLMDPLAREAA